MEVYRDYSAVAGWKMIMIFTDKQSCTISLRNTQRQGFSKSFVCGVIGCHSAFGELLTHTPPDCPPSVTPSLFPLLKTF
jgi:hypothetical protein